MGLGQALAEGSNLTRLPPAMSIARLLVDIATAVVDGHPLLPK